MRFFTRLFHRQERHLPACVVRTSRRSLPGLLVRQYLPTDFSACVQLYKDNEPGRFPPGVLNSYAEHLQRQRALVLVVEKAGQVIGTAGIHSTYHHLTLFYWLTYGLVAPGFHHQGVGTVLLLARLAVLPEPAQGWLVGMMCVAGSRTFYERFGFRRFREYPEGSPLVAGDFLATVSARQIRRARTHLSKQGIHLQPDAFRVPLQPSDSKETP